MTKNDEIYYANESELEEYILNEVTVMHKWHCRDAWLLGQFSTVCLETVLHLLALCLEDKLLNSNEFGDASAVVRALAVAKLNGLISNKIMKIEFCQALGPVAKKLWRCTGTLVCKSVTDNRGVMLHIIAVCRCIGVPCRIVTLRNFAPRIEYGTSINLDLIDDMVAEKNKDTVCFY
ncbi:unnamed protein product [Thelazia callipaeda]|uniref:TGc domain-containing protein n=1 Tax=Thelazia callipaeda TaxID=103827 RepID=A0A0N5CXS5_THECL|nr:unnamed protein product [Thelazia callipaeda]